MAVHVKARARQEGLTCEHASGYRVAVKDIPEKGRANKRVCQVLAAFFGVPAARVEIIRGHTASNKQVRIHGLAPEAAEAKLAELTGKGLKS